MKYIAAILTFSISALWCQTSSAGFDHSQKSWTDFLKKSVIIKDQASFVNYRTIKQNPDELNAYVRSVEAVSRADYEKFSSNEKLAFLINAYNALTIKLIIDHYPIRSIKDIGSIFRSPWKIEFFNLLGHRSDLDKIEHGLIRNEFSEPRIHFALVCASLGCPALRNEAYVGTRLDDQLEAAPLGFLRDGNKNRYSAKQVELSSIFKWYGHDFEKKFGSVRNFVAPRLTENAENQKSIRDEKTAIVFLDYDWSINEAK
jgi:hypothetical protein